VEKAHSGPVQPGATFPTGPEVERQAHATKTTTRFVENCRQKKKKEIVVVMVMDSFF
jgi:hypothetical protein